MLAPVPPPPQQYTNPITSTINTGWPSMNLTPQNAFLYQPETLGNEFSVLSYVYGSHPCLPTFSLLALGGSNLDSILPPDANPSVRQFRVPSSTPVV